MDESAPITVGLDGSAESLAAAHWAADEAARRGLGLCLLHAWIMMTPEPAESLSHTDPNYWAKRIISAARTEIQQRHPDLPITEELVAERPDAALLAAAEDAAMIVLGSRGLHRLESFFLGDVSLQLAGRAESPVVLVRVADGERRHDDAPPGPVVVGISLNGPCDDLLEFAFAGAAARRAPLHIVHGRSLPVQAYAPWGIDPDVAQAVSGDAARELSEALEPWRTLHPEVSVTQTVRLGSPARAVLSTAEGAGLLVVGRRRHHAALTPRLGNVAQACVHHAPCPVAVVPHN
ncbi:universal stress protein [Streptomyces orinoci]|uniref:Universal stress protein n=1 Tax=Streptomyces orinoci TaxID=67339 RepID=A0ABV3JZN6_STRON|nr:universal stress protein [Streptomyces orinoci]